MKEKWLKYCGYIIILILMFGLSACASSEVESEAETATVAKESATATNQSEESETNTMMVKELEGNANTSEEKVTEVPVAESAKKVEPSVNLDSATIHKLGSTAVDENWKVTVHSVRETPAKGEIVEGYIYFHVKATIENVKSEDGRFYTHHHTFLRGEDGRRYKLRSRTSEEIAIGKKLETEISFRVKENTDNLEFVFKPYDGERLTWKVKAGTGKKPTAPTIKSSDQILALGDTTEIDNYRVTVNGWKPAQGILSQPEEGNVFVLVDVTLENIGEETKMIFGDEIQLIDYKNLVSFNRELFNSDFDDELTGDIYPGEKLRAEVAFQVPVSTEHLGVAYESFEEKNGVLWKAM